MLLFTYLLSPVTLTERSLKSRAEKTLDREVWLESSCRVDSHKQTPESPAKEQVQQLLCIVEIAGASPNRGFHPIRVVRFSL